MKLARLLFSLRGRIPRAVLWWTGLGLAAAFFVLMVFLETAFGRQASLVLYPPLAWSIAALAVKRLHDQGRSPARLLALLIPVIGPLWIAIQLGFRRGTQGENQYGRDPLEIHRDYLTVR